MAFTSWPATYVLSYPRWDVQVYAYRLWGRRFYARWDIGRVPTGRGGGRLETARGPSSDWWTGVTRGPRRRADGSADRAAAIRRADGSADRCADLTDLPDGGP